MLELENEKYSIFAANSKAMHSQNKNHHDCFPFEVTERCIAVRPFHLPLGWSSD